MFIIKGAQRSFVTMAIITALVMPSVCEGAAAEDELGSKNINITIQDLARENAHSISTQKMTAKNIGTNTEYFESIFAEPLTLYGSPFANVDLVEYADVKKAEYQFIKVDEAYPKPSFTNLSETRWLPLKLEKSYRDIITNKVGQLSVQRYDVSALKAQQEPELWKDRTVVYTKPIGSMMHISTGYSTTTSAYTNTGGSNNTYVPNTVFLNNLSIGTNLKMAMKLWGYIIPDTIGKNNNDKFQAGNYYLGIISDDAAIGYITVPNADGNADENIWFSDYFYHHASAFVSTNKPVYLKPGEPYPLYMEYFNWGGDAEFRIVYSKKPFTFDRVFTSVSNYTTENNPSKNYPTYVLAEKSTANSVADGGFQYLDRLIKEHNNKSNKAVEDKVSATTTGNVKTNNEVWELPSTWFRGSSNTTPGERSTAVFMSKASEGVYFPATTGTYYLAVRMTSENKDKVINNTQALMGPYVISDAVLTATKNPSNWTKENVEIRIYPASGTTSAIEHVRLPNGTTRNSWLNDGNGNYISYTVSENGMYKFKVKERGVSVEKDFDVFVDNIDRTAPTLSYTLTPDDWTNGNVTVNLSATDTQSKVHYLYDASGNKSLNTEVETTIIKSFGGITKNGDYKFRAEDAVGNKSEELVVTVRKIDKLSPKTGVPTVDIVWNSETLSPAASVAISVSDQEATTEYGKSDIRGIKLGDTNEQPISSISINNANIGDVINYSIADNAGNITNVTHTVGNLSCALEDLIANVTLKNLQAKANGEPVDSVSIVPNGRAQGILTFDVVNNLFMRNDSNYLMELGLTDTLKIMSLEITDSNGHSVECEFDKDIIKIKDDLFVGQYKINLLVAVDEARVYKNGAISLKTPIKINPYGINVTNTENVPWRYTGSDFKYNVSPNPKVK